MDAWPEGKFLIDTVNAHSFVVAQKDEAFAKALMNSDALLPDGISIVKACRWLGTENVPFEKIAGADLFSYEMGKLEAKGGTCRKRIRRWSMPSMLRIRTYSGWA